MIEYMNELTEIGSDVEAGSGKREIWRGKGETEHSGGASRWGPWQREALGLVLRAVEVGGGSLSIGESKEDCTWHLALGRDPSVSVGTDLEGAGDVHLASASHVVRTQ